MNDEDRKLMNETIAAGVHASNEVIVHGMAGSLLAVNMLTRELIIQKVIDKDKFLASIAQVRATLITSNVHPQFAKAFETMTSAVLKSGDDTPEWLDELLHPKPK
jgi:hypothetical protein